MLNEEVAFKSFVKGNVDNEATSAVAIGGDVAGNGKVAMASGDDSKGE